MAAHGELDPSSVDILRGALDEAVRPGAQDLVLDLNGLMFIDSTGLHLLIERDAAARRTATGLRSGSTGRRRCGG